MKVFTTGSRVVQSIKGSLGVILVKVVLDFVNDDAESFLYSFYF